MAVGGSRFDDPSYKNWLKDTLALMYMKEGLEDFSDAMSKLFYAKLLSSCGTGTSRCTSGCTFRDLIRDSHNQRWYMRCKHCDKWLKEFTYHHTDMPCPKLSPENTDPQKWHTDHWETSKLFMSYGCRTDTCAKDCDIHGILSLFINSQYFYTSRHIGRADLLDELQEIRNTLFHSGTFQVSGTDVNNDLQKIIDFLQGMTGLTGSQTQKIQDAVRKIQELKANRLDLSLNRELELRALQQKQIEMDREMKRLENTVESLKKEQDSLKTTVDSQDTKLSSNYTAIKQHGDSIKELLSVKVKLNQFLTLNGLDQDFKKIVNTFYEHGQSISQLDTVSKQHELRIDQLDTVSNQNKQRIEQLDGRTRQHGSVVGLLGEKITELKEDIKHDREAQDERFGQLGGKVHTLEEQMKTKADVCVDSSSKTWEKQCKDLQSWLIAHYKDLGISSPCEDDTIGFKHIYVDPSFSILRESDLGHGGLKKVNDHCKTLSCRKIFTTENYNCRKIYVTGDAGTGKSVLCQQLLRLWCEAHTDSESHSDREESDSESHSDIEDSDNESHSDEEKEKESREDRKVRREENMQIFYRFQFLFYLQLRDCGSTCEVPEMIQNQILKFCKVIQRLDASDLLENHCCLIIADGLDEWVCPEGTRTSGIPVRDFSNANNVILTTTRPWKFDILQLKSSQVDKHIELCELSNQSSSELCSNVIKILTGDKTYRKKSKDFFRALKEKGLTNFKAIPILFIQLIYLWHDNQELPRSQVQLYCAMINLMLKKSKKNLSELTTNAPSGTSEILLHKCIMDYPYCRNHQQIIYYLSRLAVNALFDKTQENRLVFESSQKEIYELGPDAIDMCLKSGILSQSKVLDKVSVSEKKMSFLHKKLQEFLASLFIAGSVDSRGFLKRIFTKTSTKQIKHMTDFCSTIDTCLEMSQVYMFMSGLRLDLTQQLLTHFTHVVTADKHKQLQKYRQTGLVPHLIRDIQACITDCVVEGSYHGYKYDNLCLADFYITKTTLCHITPLFVCTKRSKVKSVYMETEGTDKDQVRAIISQLQQCHSVQRLYLFDPEPCYIHVDTVTVIVNNNINTLTSLVLHSVFTATDDLVTALCSLSSSKCLMALGLSCLMTHKHIEQIIARVSQSPTIRQLGLALGCTDHGGQCRPRIDVSTMTHKQILGLCYMSVDNLQSVSHCVERVTLGDVTLPVTALHEFTRSISQTTRYVKVKLDNVTVTEVTDGQVDMETFLRTCPGLKVTKCQYNDSNKTWSIHFKHYKPRQ